MADVQELIQRIRASERAKRVHKAQWLLNTLYFKGYQWQAYNETLGIFQDLGPRHEWKVRVVENYVRPIALTMAAKLTQNRPTWTVLPATMDSDDRNKARVSQRLLDYTWDECELQPKLYEAVLWSVLTGQGFWALYWDRNKNPQEFIDDDGKRVVKPIGFPSIDVVAPFDIGLDPLADSVENCEWGYRVRLASTEWVKEQIGKRVDGSDMADFDPDLDPRQQRSSLFNDVQTGDVYGDKYTPVWEFYDTVAQKLYWLTKEKILRVDDWKWPVPFVEFPFVKNLGDVDGNVLTAGGVWGDTVISDIIDPQRELNKTSSQILEIKNLTSFPRLLVTRAAAVRRQDVTDMPGSMVPWSGNGQKPEQLNIGAIPSYLYQLPDRLIQRMFDLSGVHEISQGTSPGSIQSGRGLAILAEMDATKFGPPARNISRAIRQAAIQILKLWKAYSEYPQMLRVVGDSNMLELDEFDAGDIESFDVKIQEGSTMATNKSLRTDQILQMWQLGIEQDPRKIKKMLEFGDMETVAGDFDLDRLKQRREIQRILGGEEVGIDPWDDNHTHIDETEMYLKSTDFENIENDVIRQRLVKHWQMHKEAMAAQQQAEAVAAQQRGIASSGAGARQEIPDVSFMQGIDTGGEANPVGRVDQMIGEGR